MKPFAISVIAVCSALMLASASYVPATKLSAPDPKYGVADLSWAVETIPGNASSTIILNGTVQEVYRQLNDTNPDYTDLLNKYWASNPSVSSPDAFRSFDSMDDRPDCGYCKVCTRRWQPAGIRTILEGITYLKSLKSKPAISPGPGFCSRVSCDWGQQIWWCNDNDERKELDSWDPIIYAAEDITHQCNWYTYGMKEVTGGQIFEPDGWNVVIRGEGSDC